MSPRRYPLMLLAAGAFSALAAAFALAAEPTTPAPADPAQREERSLQGFGAANPTCGEWNDGCATCRRGDDGVIHCSTPGIACQPADQICKTTVP